jgi:mRNA-degrading endonuclease RelE of RelBE toxin-antitoxin system
MAKVVIKQMPAFKKTYKKLHAKQKVIVDKAIRDIVKNPMLGQEKKGDLSQVHVYKFKINRQEMLLAYEWNPELRLLLALGVHENFYRNLKH